ncbi:hypothetical protein DPMN_142200 [Dreissena polymorpha]|uniref:Uncharacterized protein n=1 Tax=Dreissena polymorpha TaxID=45954 RepID=A0A9D4GE44_DREPO|nr:hypothetical protein DPMN_142200 [Dreissena polymorpha]
MQFWVGVAYVGGAPHGWEWGHAWLRLPVFECRLVLFCKEDFILGESKGYMDRQFSRGIFSNNKLFLSGRGLGMTWDLSAEFEANVTSTLLIDKRNSTELEFPDITLNNLHQSHDMLLATRGRPLLNFVLIPRRVTDQTQEGPVLINYTRSSPGVLHPTGIGL